MVKLLVSDFDHTLNNDDDYEKNIEAVNSWRLKGNIFVVASGRQSQRLIEELKRVNLVCDYIICNDGGIIFDNNFNVIHQKDIPQNLVKPIINMFQNSKCIKMFYIDRGLDVTNDSNSSANGIIGMVNNIDDGNKLLNEIIRTYSDVHGYVDPIDGWICITEKSVTKDYGVDIINSILNVDKNDIYTIGDNINDLSLSYYNSYCMKNSDEALKNVCKGEYDSVNELIDDVLRKLL